MLEVDEKYLKEVERRITDVLRAPVTFCALIERCQGAHPHTVKAILDGMLDAGIVLREADMFVLANGSFNAVEGDAGERTIEDRCNVVEPELPEPHPADYDWRFTLKTRCKVAEHIAETVKPGGRVALLGTPTLLSHLVHRRLDPLLIEWNDVIVSALEREGFSQRLLRHDLFLPLPMEQHGRFQAVVADAPWYLPFVDAFLLRASECAEVGAKVLITFPPPLTRPEVANDRAHVLRFAREVGLDLTVHELDFFWYQTPEFERLDLAARGIECLDWRSGHLLKFLRTEAMPPTRSTTRPEAEPEWRDYWLNGLRVKVKLPLGESGRHFRATEVRLADLDSVSRRAPVRGRIDVWTSRNRAYEIDGVAVLDDVFRRLAAGSSVHDAVHQSAAAFDVYGSDLERLNAFVDSLLVV